MHYKGTPKRLPEIAKELDVQAVLEGSIQRWGNQVRITVQLIEATGRPSPLERSLRWGAGRRPGLAEAKLRLTLLEKCKISVTGEQRIRLTETRPVDPEAYEAFLVGHHHMRKRTARASANALKFSNALSKRIQTMLLP